jgi:hypothetical protein
MLKNEEQYMVLENGDKKIKSHPFFLKFIRVHDFPTTFTFIYFFLGKKFSNFFFSQLKNIIYNRHPHSVPRI